jgi:tRNA-Thr(GGU) m(6)t(6)A37 methyltransferase TsaA
MKMKPIGTIHTPFTEVVGMPVQPAGAIGINGTVEVYQEYHAGLKDLSGFSHIVLLFLLHRSIGFELEVVPFMDTESRGLFATRAPRRPNPIGLSIVQLDRIEGGTLYIQNVDMLDGTPLLDIKPYVPELDSHEQVRSGWIDQVRKTLSKRQWDERFR